MSRSEKRRAAIRRLVLESSLVSQAELRAKLKVLGFRASQPVLSRDLRLLRVAKEAGIYQIREPERVTPLSALKSLLRTVDTAREYLLLRCEPGAASAIARALEAEELEGLVGTVAGDDTVLVALASKAAAQRVKKRLALLVSDSSTP
jgi:transcriptional regulator of arginine metabolism